MGHYPSTSKRDSIKARTDEDPMCVGFISLGSKVLHWLRNLILLVMKYLYDTSRAFLA